MRAKNPRRWVDEIGQLLNKSRFTIYKKFDGTTALSLDEAATLVRTYQIDLGVLINGSHSLVLKPFSGVTPAEDATVAQTFLEILKRARAAPGAHLYVLTGRIPLGYLAQFPRLFEMIERGPPVLQNAGRQRKPDLMDNPYWLAALRDIGKLYRAIPRTEFWNPWMLSGINMHHPGFGLPGSGKNRPMEKDILTGDVEDLVDFLVHSVTNPAQPLGKFIPAILSSGFALPVTVYMVARDENEKLADIQAFTHLAHGTWLTGHINGGSSALYSQLELWKRNAVSLYSSGGMAKEEFFRSLRRLSFSHEQVDQL